MSIDSISGPLYYTPDSILGNSGKYFPRHALDNFRFYNAVLSVNEVAACETASPQNITFLVSAGNVSATTLAPHHPVILSAVTTSLNIALSQMSIASVADTAHNSANLRLVAADVPGADVDTLSQKTNEVAAAVKDAVNTAAGGSAVVCAAKAATILGSGANLTVYC